LQGNMSVGSIRFSPDGKQIAVSGLDYKLALYNTSGGAARKIDSPKNTIVRITPDWKKILFIKLVTDGQKTWASITVKDPKTLADIGTAKRFPIRNNTALEDAYVGNSRVILCGSIGEGDVRTGFCSLVDFEQGQGSTITGGFRITKPTSSADDSTYAAYMEPTSLRAAGTILVLPANLSASAKQITTEACNSTAGLVLSDDGSLVGATCQRITASGTEIIGTNIYSTSSGSLAQSLPKIRVAALIAKGSRVIGWRSQIGGPIVELLDTKTGNGLGETPGTEIWLSRDEKLAAQATPDGVVTIYKLNQP
jgi:hypothetical protein